MQEKAKNLARDAAGFLNRTTEMYTPVRREEEKNFPFPFYRGRLFDYLI